MNVDVPLIQIVHLLTNIVQAEIPLQLYVKLQQPMHNVRVSIVLNPIMSAPKAVLNVQLQAIVPLQQHQYV